MGKVVDDAMQREEYDDFDYDDVDDSGDVELNDDTGYEDEDTQEVDADEQGTEAEGSDDGGDVDEDDADGTDETAETTEDASGEAQRVKFSKEQQKVVDQIVQKRLERKDTQFVKQISEVAGVQLEAEEITQSAKLWGLLKSNPELSEAVDIVIAAQLKSGKAKEVVSNDANRASVLEVKEAILDLKIKDPLFRKNGDKILEWADDQGYSVNSKKSLQLAVLAWKGSKDSVLAKANRVSEQKKQSAKKATQQRAGVQGGKSAKTQTSTDFRKMSDKDVLTRNGLSLFTDE